MKRFDVKKRLATVISFAVLACMMVGIVPSFPLATVIEAEASDENIYYDHDDYVILGADAMEGRLSVPNQTDFKFSSSNGVPCLLLCSKWEEGKNYDPFISYTPDGSYSADDYKYVALVVKSNVATNTMFQLFYTNDRVASCQEAASGKGHYQPTTDWQVLTFDFSQNSNWAGGMKSFRIDYYSGDPNATNRKVVSVAAMILCKTPEDVYDATLNFFRDNLYKPEQTLSDFTEDEVDCFVKAEGTVPDSTEKWLPSLDTTVFAAEGNLIYNYKYDPTVAHGGPDPYAGFFYHDLMDKRGIAESERLDTSDFGYTVIKYRTSGDVGSNPLFQTFYFANGNKWPTWVDSKSMSPSTNYIKSEENDWKLLVIDMKGNGSEAGWKGRFDGFRVDWASPDSKDTTARMEISDIMFFADGEKAESFVNAFNTVKLAVPEQTVYSDYENPIKLSDDCLMLLPEQLMEKIENSDNSTSRVAVDKGVDVLRLETTKTVNEPYVTLNTDINADEYKYITVMAKSSVWTQSAMKLEYYAASTKTEDHNRIVRRYDGNSEWTLITVPLEGIETWVGVVDSIKLTYLCYDPVFTGFGKGVSVDIAGIAFSKTADALYDSAYHLMTSVYRPTQVLTNFSESDAEAFAHNTARTNVSFENGDLVFKGASDYLDPWVSLYYKKLMDLRGVDAADRVTTADFNTTVIRYRTSPQIELPGMTLFLYTDTKTGPYQYEPGKFFTASANYSATYYDTWRSMCISMNGNTSTAQYWTGDFNGFRMDWCGNSNVGEYMEISELFFFDDSATAKKFTETVNSLYQPTLGEYNGEYMTSVPTSDDYLLITPDKLIDKLTDSSNSTYYSAKNAGVPAVRLEVTEASVNPYVTYSPDNLSADEYKYLTMMVRSEKAYGATLAVNYSTDKSKSIDNQYSTADYSTHSDWQFITVNFSGNEGWTGIVEELKIGYLCTGMQIGEGVTYDIAGIAFCKDEEAVCDAAYSMAAQVYKPTQVLTDFSDSDADYFGGTGVNGHTALSFDNGNLKFTATSYENDENLSAVSDLQRSFNYISYANAKGIKPLTTDAFQYTVIRYRSHGVNSDKTRIELFIFTGSSKSPIVKVDGAYDSHAGEARYTNTGTWRTVVINMAEDDGDKNNSESSKFAWNIEGQTTAFNGFRFDWCDEAAVGAQMEVSDLIFFASVDDASQFSSAINTVSIPAPRGDDVPPDDGWEDESDSEESVPEFDNSEESESNEETESETDTETETETDTDTESDTETDRETDTDTDTDTNDGDDDPTIDPEEETEPGNGAGSQAPFVIVCFALVCLTGASLMSVLIIRIRAKNE